MAWNFSNSLIHKITNHTTRIMIKYSETGLFRKHMLLNMTLYLKNTKLSFNFDLSIETHCIRLALENNYTATTS